MVMQQLPNTLPSLPPSEIKGTSETYKGLIMTQLNRLLYLTTLGTAKYQGAEQMFNEDTQLQATLKGLLGLESILTPVLNENYYLEANQIKKELRQKQKNSSIDTYAKIFNWLTLLIKNLDKLNLLPEQEIELEFD